MKRKKSSKGQQSNPIDQGDLSDCGYKGFSDGTDDEATDGVGAVVFKDKKVPPLRCPRAHCVVSQQLLNATGVAKCRVLQMQKRWSSQSTTNAAKIQLAPKQAAAPVSTAPAKEEGELSDEGFAFSDDTGSDGSGDEEGGVVFRSDEMQASWDPSSGEQKKTSKPAKPAPAQPKAKKAKTAPASVFDVPSWD